MRREAAAFAIAFLAVLPLHGQIETVAGGVVGDSSVVVPVVTWNRVAPDGNTILVALNGWTVFAEGTRRVAPARRRVGSIAVTPLNAHGSDRVYLGGERNDEISFENAAFEVTFGRIDQLGERWTSEVRLVGLYERVEKTDATTRAFWSSPYAGLRTRLSRRHITAENPLLMTFEGSEVRADVEIFGGENLWSRLALHQRFNRRRGNLRVGEHAAAFYGRSIDPVNAFLAGGAWPGNELPLYGYRYAELRLDRGIGVSVDVQCELRDWLAVGAHVSVLHSRESVARGTAVDVSGMWKGIGFRLGVAVPDQKGRIEEDVVVYGSILAARFIRGPRF